MARALLALGANLGDRQANLRDALARLDGCGQVDGVSSLYASEALVMPGQPPGPEYLNAVCELDTPLAPEALLDCVKRIEREMGRQPGERWAPRPIDIDIILFDDRTVQTDALTIPHRAAVQRNFVMVPLAELAPDLVHPVLGRTVAEVGEELEYDGLRHVAGPEWAGERFAPNVEGADV